MRVLVLSTEFPPGPGGIGTHAYQLASGLHERGWQVLVLTRQDVANDNEIEAFNRQQPFENDTIVCTVRFWMDCLFLLSSAALSYAGDRVSC
jgi:hypothetical protein